MAREGGGLAKLMETLVAESEDEYSDDGQSEEEESKEVYIMYTCEVCIMYTCPPLQQQENIAGTQPPTTGKTQSGDGKYFA